MSFYAFTLAYHHIPLSSKHKDKITNLLMSVCKRNQIIILTTTAAVHQLISPWQAARCLSECLLHERPVRVLAVQVVA